MKSLRLAVALALLVPFIARALDEGLGEVPKEIDRSSPLACVQGFLNAAHRGHYPEAAFYLNLDHLPAAKQPVEGPRLARRLRFILDRQLWLDLTAISREPEGAPARPGYDQIGTIPLEKSTVPVRVSRFKEGEETVWVFSRDTVRAVDRLYEVYGPPLGDKLPEVFFAKPLGGLELWQWIGIALSLLGAIAVGWLIEKVLLGIGSRLARLTRAGWDNQLVHAGRGPLRLALWALLLGLGTAQLLLPPSWAHGLDVLQRSLGVLSAAWFALRFLDFASGVVEGRVASGEQSSANARSVRTQLAVLRRVLGIGVYFLAAAALLMQFDVVRTVGVSLLASAGVAGVVLGLAAQRSIGALLAGIQLSITQPIRIGDQVVLEGENGIVEEVHLTFVVVRIWDLRRMVIPMTYFLEKPFQNWSRGSADMLGTVLLQVDWQTDVEALRGELKRVLEGEGKALWNGRTGKLEVTDSTERTLTLRALVSSNVDLLWDLRCLVRERLVGFVREHPEWLPTLRTEPTDGVASARASTTR